MFLQANANAPSPFETPCCARLLRMRELGWRSSMYKLTSLASWQDEMPADAYFATSKPWPAKACLPFAPVTAA